MRLASWMPAAAPAMWSFRYAESASDTRRVSLTDDVAGGMPASARVLEVIAVARVLAAVIAAELLPLLDVAEATGVSALHASLLVGSRGGVPTPPAEETGAAARHRRRVLADAAGATLLDAQRLAAADPHPAAVERL